MFEQLLLGEWAHLLLRWFHLIAGIMWIGTSFYFVWLDSAFEPLKQEAHGKETQGVDGELYMVHGGFFYRVEKRRFGASGMPSNLHWFIWEATLTWASGFVLLCVLYYPPASAYLLDPLVSSLTHAQGVGLGLATMLVGWLIYDGLFRIKALPTWLQSALGLLGLTALIFLLNATLSGRAAYIHIAALLGTCMVFNVWVHILPNQRAIIAAAKAGLEPNYELGLKAKKRSMHNSYMTLGVLFVMISNHFAHTYGSPYRAWILILLIVLGALVRRSMITGSKKVFALAVLVLLALIGITASPKQQALNGATSFATARTIIQSRCLNCHSTSPTDAVFKVAPSGVMFDQDEWILKWKSRILERVKTGTMPLANQTGMTSEERAQLVDWAQSPER